MGPVITALSALTVPTRVSPTIHFLCSCCCIRLVKATCSDREKSLTAFTVSIRDVVRPMQGGSSGPQISFLVDEIQGDVKKPRSLALSGNAVTCLKGKRPKVRGDCHSRDDSFFLLLHSLLSIFCSSRLPWSHIHYSPSPPPHSCRTPSSFIHTHTHTHISPLHLLYSGNIPLPMSAALRRAVLTPALCISLSSSTMM